MDGGTGEEDLTANAEIPDPGGPASSGATATCPEGSGGCLIVHIR